MSAAASVWPIPKVKVQNIDKMNPPVPFSLSKGHICTRAMQMEGRMQSSVHSLPLPLSQIVWKDDSLLDHDSVDCLPTTRMGTPLCSSLRPAKQAPS